MVFRVSTATLRAVEGGDSAAAPDEGDGNGRAPAAAAVPGDGAAVSDRFQVHPTVRAAAEWCWRLLVIVAAVYVLALLFERFAEVLVPVALAVLGSAFLVPAVDWLHRHRVPRSLAVIVMMVLALGAVAGVLTFVGRAFADGFPQLTDEITQTVDRTREWLVDGPLHVDDAQVRDLGTNVVTLMEHNQAKLAGGAVATATTATEIVTGALLIVFLMIFFLYGGGRIWEFCTRIVPTGSRARVAAAGVAGFSTLVAYVRATVAVALVDALCIGIGLAVLQVPLAVPLASLVFLGAFIPIVGALISGAVAVVIALVSQGWITAIIVLALLVGVMQLEGHVLQPFLLGRSVRLHPVAVVLAIGAGIVSAGIVGGLLAVPIIAFGNTAVRYLLGHPVVHDARMATPGGLGSAEVYPAEPDEPHWDRRNLGEITADPADPAEPGPHTAKGDERSPDGDRPDGDAPRSERDGGPGEPGRPR